MVVLNYKRKNATQSPNCAGQPGVSGKIDCAKPTRVLVATRNVSKQIDLKVALSGNRIFEPMAIDNYCDFRLDVAFVKPADAVKTSAEVPR